MAADKPSAWGRALPSLTLMLMAPLLTEVLPGATRFSAIFVFPIEVCVWGGAAVLIREVVRRARLGWLNMLLLALALSIAEECVIQQTSLAPMVLQLKHEVYARAFGVNYVYFLWALAYESVFAVLAPVALTELIFRDRRDQPWLSSGGLIAVLFFICAGSFLAWFSWTQHARPMVFHVPVYNPPAAYVLAALGVILALVLAALGPFRRLLARPGKTSKPPAPWALWPVAAIWAVLQYGFVLLGFGIAPDFPPSVAVGVEVALAVVVLLGLPRFAQDPRWRPGHAYAVLCGAMVGSMAVSFIGFPDVRSPDFLFKAAVDAIAMLLLIVLGLRRGSEQSAEVRPAA